MLMPYCLRKIFDWLERKLRSHDSQIPIETREFLLRCIPILRKSVLYIHRLHLAFFYLRGIFYHIAKRVAGVQYVSIGFRSIMCIMIILFHAQISCLFS